LSDQPQSETIRDFLPISDPVEAEKYLSESARTLSSCMFWTKDQEHVINSHICSYRMENKFFHAWTPKEFDPNEFMDSLTKQGLTGCFFSVSLTRANIFFKADYLGHDAIGLKFRFPLKIFKVQRRKDMRFTIPDGYVLKTEFQDPLNHLNNIVKKIVDVSAGGVSFMISDLEEPIFKPGLILRGLTMIVAGRKITCDAEVRHTRVPSGSSYVSGFKTGLKFTNIKAADAQHLAAYVFEESRRFLTRFL